jgi:hypothetical protein
MAAVDRDQPWFTPWGRPLDGVRIIPGRGQRHPRGRCPAVGPQPGEGGLDVVTHKVQLVMARPVGWLNGKLGQGQREAELAPACVSAVGAPRTSAKNARTLAPPERIRSHGLHVRAAILAAGRPAAACQRARRPCVLMQASAHRPDYRSDHHTRQYVMHAQGHRLRQRRAHAHSNDLHA